MSHLCLIIKVAKIIRHPKDIIHKEIKELIKSGVESRLSIFIPSSIIHATGKYPDSTVTNHSVSPSLAPHHKTCIYHSHHKDGNCKATTTETLQQSAPLLYITIQSLCPSLDLDIFQFHFNNSH